MSEEMRKGWGLDSRGGDFNRDPDHAAMFDAPRQEPGQGEGKHRAHAGSAVHGPERGSESGHLSRGSAVSPCGPSTCGQMSPDSVTTSPQRDASGIAA